MTEVDSVLPEGTNTNSTPTPAAAAATTTTTTASSTVTATPTPTISSAVSSSTVPADSTASTESTTTTTPTNTAVDATKSAETTTTTTTTTKAASVDTTTSTTSTTATTSSASPSTTASATVATAAATTKTATSIAKDNGIALAADALVLTIDGSMAPTDSVQACSSKERRPDAAVAAAPAPGDAAASSDAVKPMEVDDDEAGEEDEDEEVQDDENDVGEENDSQITSSTENGEAGEAGDANVESANKKLPESSASSPSAAEKSKATAAVESSKKPVVVVVQASKDVAAATGGGDAATLKGDAKVESNGKSTSGSNNNNNSDNSCDKMPTTTTTATPTANACENNNNNNNKHSTNSRSSSSGGGGGNSDSNNKSSVTNDATDATPLPEVEKNGGTAVSTDAKAKERSASPTSEGRREKKSSSSTPASPTKATTTTTTTTTPEVDAEKPAKASTATPADAGESQPKKPQETSPKADKADGGGGEQVKSNGKLHDAPSAKVEPMDTTTTTTTPTKASSELSEKNGKENGIAGDIERAKDDIVSLDDDSDEEEAESNKDPLALPTKRSAALPKPNGEAMALALTMATAAIKGVNNAAASKDGVQDLTMMTPKKSLSSDSDGAVIIGSDSENEAATVQSRPAAAPPQLSITAVQPKDMSKAAKIETQVIDDDDDDCVVIEDDTPAPMASDLSKRKGGIGIGGGGGGMMDGADETQPPNKRQRNNNGNAIPSNLMVNSLSQITIKDARSLMPQEIGTKRGADGNIYPVTITPAQSLMQQGPPKLVPMTNPSTLPMPGLPGLTCNANLLPGLTDDMFVLEAPSFIVPYIYEKPPPDNLKDVIRDIQSKHQLSKEDLADADKSDEFDMITEQNKEDKDEKSSGSGSASSSKNKSKKRRRGDDESWSEESEEDEDDDDDDSESGMRTKVLIKEASDDLTAIKGAIKPAAAVAQSAATAAGMGKPGQENYFESPLGKFFMDIGVGLVQEFVQSDLIRLQKRKMRKSIGKNITEFERAITALSGNLEASKKKNSPFKFTMKRCEFCNFKSESALAMANHYETPHMHGIQYKCNFCTFEIRNATEIVYHMEAIHNIKARLIKPLPYHQCPNCGFEDNGKAKLARHQPVCAKKFRPELNLAPPTDWEAPAKIPRIKPRHGLVGTATAYQAMAAQAAAQAAAQKAALASIQQQQQAARNLQAAALAAQAANKIRGRPPMLQQQQVQQQQQQKQIHPPIPPNTATSMLRGPAQVVRNPMPTNVVLPNNFQMAASQLLPQHAANAMSNKKNMPSVSITPLPRQSAVVPPAVTTPSTSKMPPAGMKPGQSPNATGKTQFVICEICDYYIKDLEQLRNHMQSMHKVKIHPKMIYNRPPLNCQKCQFRFFTDQGLERHLLGSHGLVTSSMQEAANKSKDGGRCPVCGKTYLCKLLNHVSRDHHMTLKPAHLSYKCTVCTATFGMYKQFETHVYTAHSTVAKKAMDAKKGNNNNQTSSSSSSSNQSSAASSSNNNQRNNNLGMYNDSLLKPLKINDEITIIPQPASKSRITNMESHVID